MLLTNDGAWAQRVMHPRYGLEREYAVLLDRCRPMPTSRTCDPGPTSRTGLHGCSRRGEAAARPRSRSRTTPSPPARGSSSGSGRGASARFDACSWPPATASIGWCASASGRSARRPGTRRVATADRGGHHLGGRPTAHGDSGPPVARDEAGPGGRGRHVRLGKEHRRPPWPCASAPASSIPGSCTAVTLATLEAGIDPCRCSSGRPGPRDAHPGPRGGSRPWPRFRCDEERVTIGRRDVTRSREPRIERAVLIVSRHAEVRAAMLAVQRQAARPRHGDGRSRHRHRRPARRRPQGLDRIGRDLARAVRAADGPARPVDDLPAGDHRARLTDTTRAVAPLRRAPGALVLDTGELDVDGCVAIVAALPSMDDP